MYARLWAIGVLLVCGSSFAQGGGDLRSRALALLNGYHRLPTAVEWKKLDPAAGSVLLTLYAESADLTARRLRILEALKYFPSPAATALLADTADRDPLSPLRRQALSTLIYLHGAGERPRLARLLQDGDWRLRRRVIEELLRLGDTASLQLVERHLKTEPSPLVRQAAADAKRKWRR